MLSSRSTIESAVSISVLGSPLPSHRVVREMELEGAPLRLNVPVTFATHTRAVRLEIDLPRAMKITIPSLEPGTWISPGGVFAIEFPLEHVPFEFPQHIELTIHFTDLPELGDGSDPVLESFAHPERMLLQSAILLAR